MKITVVQNGVLSMAIVPETEMEILILKELGKGEVTFQVHEKLQILDKMIPNAAVITPKPKDGSIPTSNS